jgi:DNA-binding transcriptional LysR family regulator
MALMDGAMAHLDLKKLEHFVCATRHLNVSAAAEELHLTQPELSRSLQSF